MATIGKADWQKQERKEEKEKTGLLGELSN